METREPSAQPDAQPDPAHPQRQVLAACNLCEAICGLELTIEDRPEGPKVTSIRGNPDDPLSRGHICPKGVALADIHEDPDRLRRPVKRVGEGPDARWEEISWDEALDLTADGIARAINEHGRNALGVYLGNPNVHSLGAQTHGVLMLKSFKTRNKFSATSVDQLPHQFVAWQLFGHQLLIPIADIDRTSYFLVFGANPMASNGSLMTVPDFPNRLRELKKRGGRMVVFDPRRTETAKVADEHHFVRPATDAVVLLAMVHVLLEEGLADPPAYVRGVESVRLAVADITPEYAAEASGVPAEEIRRITREFAAADGAAAYGRVGLSTPGLRVALPVGAQPAEHPHRQLRPGGRDAVPRAGGGHRRQGDRRVAATTTSGAAGCAAYRSSAASCRSARCARRSRPPARDRSAPCSPSPATRCSRPPTARGSRARSTAWTSWPPSTSTSTRPPGTPTWCCRRPRRWSASSTTWSSTRWRCGTPRGSPRRPSRRPRARCTTGRSSARSPCAPAARLKHKKTMAKALAERVSLNLSPTTILSTLLLTGRRTTMRALRAKPAGVDLGPLRPTMPERLQTKDKLIHLAPDLVVADLARLRRTIAEMVEHHSPDGDSNGDLLLIGRRHQRDNNSWMHNTERLTRGKPRHQLLMHPDDLASRGLTDGAPVHVASRVGKVTTEVTRDRGHDARGGLAAARLRPPARRRTAGQREQGRRRLGQRPHRPRALDVSGIAALNGVPVTVSPGLEPGGLVGP